MIKHDDTLTQAKAALRQLAGTTERIKGILDDNKPLPDRRQSRYYIFSNRFISFVLVCLVLINAGFGFILYQVATSVTSDDKSSNTRLAKLESEVRTLQAGSSLSKIQSK